MDLSGINTPWVAFTAGLITSPHCVVMCGPLAFVLLSPASASGANTGTFFCPSACRLHVIYHFARTISFTFFGILAGFLGLSLVSFLKLPLIKIFPWLLVGFLVLFALGLDKLIPKIPFAKRTFNRVTYRLSGLSKPLGALTLGLATPLLPCGPLYMVLWVALTSGDPAFGGQIALGFALGTIPLMFLANSQYYRLPKKAIHALQRLLAVLTAAFIGYRVLMAEGPLSADFCCPW